MTNEEAAKELMMAYEDLKHMCYMDCGREVAFNKACGVLRAELCGDAVSRSAVLDLMRTNWADNDGDTAMQLSIDDVRNLPAVPKQRTGKWIPVRGRLPKPFRFVNCTCHSLVDDREDWVVETIYFPQPPNSPYSDWGNIPMLNCCECEVVAWMYRDIPEPYRAEGGESE